MRGAVAYESLLVAATSVLAGGFASLFTTIPYVLAKATGPAV